jgi:hypothetical protein
MIWPNVKSLRSQVTLPRHCHFAQIKSSDVPHLLKLIPQWYPDVAVGEESCHLSAVLCVMAQKPEISGLLG